MCTRRILIVCGFNVFSSLNLIYSVIVSVNLRLLKESPGRYLFHIVLLKELDICFVCPLLEILMWFIDYLTMFLPYVCRIVNTS